MRNLSNVLLFLAIIFCALCCTNVIDFYDERCVALVKKFFFATNNPNTKSLV